MTIQGAKRLTLPAGAVGANGYTVTVTWETAGLDLTAVDTISGTRRNKVSGDIVALTGVMTAVTASTFTWQFGSADVDEAGDYEVQFTAETGGAFVRNVASDWVVWEALSADTPTPETGLVTYLRNNADGTFSYLEAAAFRTAIGAAAEAALLLVQRPTQTDIAGTTHTFTLANEGQIVASQSGSATVFTIPLNTTAAFAVGSIIGIEQHGAGVLTVTATAGVTLNGVDGASEAVTVRWGAAAIRKISTNGWVIIGAI